MYAIAGTFKQCNFYQTHIFPPFLRTRCFPQAHSCLSMKKVVLLKDIPFINQYGAE